MAGSGMDRPHVAPAIASGFGLNEECRIVERTKMDPQNAVDLGREAMMTALIIGAPILLVGVAVALVVGLLQALTQVQDQTIAFVPKIVAMIAAASLCLPWLIERMIEYSETVITNIPLTIMGG